MDELEEIEKQVKDLTNYLPVEEAEKISIKVGHILDLLMKVTRDLDAILNILDGLNNDLEGNE